MLAKKAYLVPRLSWRGRKWEKRLEEELRLRERSEKRL